MANSRFEYTRLFERPDAILPNTWIVIRLDGRGFHKISSLYEFEKPNDARALNLMNHAATAVVRELPDVVIAYGQSDEYSFVLHKSCTLFDRRESKLVSTIVSTFTAYYVHGWSKFFPTTALAARLPTFDGRAVVYPSLQNLRDYLSWRQADCHVNNLYNTTFWMLVLKGGLSTTDAEKELMGTFSSDKNEMLFSRFGINYNNEPEIFRKGSVIYRDYAIPAEVFLAWQDLEQQSEAQSSSGAAGSHEVSRTQRDKERKRQAKATVVVQHTDIIKDAFWQQKPWIVQGMQGM